MQEKTLTMLDFDDAMALAKNDPNEAKAVSPETATKLGAFFGNSPVMWMNMQVKYDLYNAAKKVGKRKLNAIEKRRSAMAA